MHLRFCEDPVKIILYTITIFNIGIKIIYFKNINKFCDNESVFRQTIFKIWKGNTINNSITMKTRFFQQKVIHGNLSIHS